MELKCFSGFEVIRALSDDAESKKVAILGRFKHQPGDAVVLLSRRHFQLDKLEALFTADTSLQVDFHNDIYSKYAGSVPIEHSLITVDMIYPATEKHIKKHTDQPRHMVRETPAMYSSVVLPYIKSLPPSRIQWVYNILEKKAEVERLIFEDPDPDVGFMLHPDLKWDQLQNKQLYCLALVHRRDLASVRDLRPEHLDLLRNIRDKAAKAIEERYGVAACDLRMFLHYQPSYYHLHVHITHVNVNTPGASVGKALLLDDVIDNLELGPADYYMRSTLTYVIGEDEELWRRLV